MSKELDIISNKLKLFTYLLFLVITGCTSSDDSETAIDKEVVRMLIIGSAEHPDPVLEMVQELEKNGILQNVIVRESFPVQIEVTGPRGVIKKIKAIPKKTGVRP